MKSNNYKNKKNIRPKRNAKEVSNKTLLALSYNPRIPRNLMVNCPVAPRKITTLHCHTGPQLIQAALATFAVYEFAINNVYSGFGLLPAPNCQFYNSYSTMYNRNRVLNFECSYDVMCNEPALPLCFGLIFRDAQPSTTITTRQLAIDALEAPFSSKGQCVGQSTGMSVFRSVNYSLHPGSVVGDTLSYMADADYAASSGAAPPQIVWGAFILYSAAGGFLTNGAFMDMSAAFKVQLTSPTG